MSVANILSHDTVINDEIETPLFRGLLTRILQEGFYNEEELEIDLDLDLDLENNSTYEEEDPCDHQSFIQSFLKPFL